MIEQSNGQGESPPVEPSLAKIPECSLRYTGKILRRTRPKTYRQIVQLLSENVPVIQIMRLCRVAQDTVIGVRNREAREISERKKTIVGILANVAELGAERMEQTIGKASLRDATIGTGVAVDKVLALTGQIPSVQIANLIMPSEEERAERRETHARLDAIVAKLGALHEARPQPEL
jgi:hypothetical protein